MALVLQMAMAMARDAGVAAAGLLCHCQQEQLAHLTTYSHGRNGASLGCLASFGTQSSTTDDMC